MDRRLVFVAIALLAVASCKKHVPMPMPANKNEVAPTDDELESRAERLFEAVVKDKPKLAEPFWFPEEPFRILKDVDDPVDYWDVLHDAFEDDIDELHDSRPSWDGTSFVRFEHGAPRRWMAPGEEHNHIGYYRELHAKVIYNTPTGVASFEVSTMITWQGRWYVTHLIEVVKPRRSAEETGGAPK